jgi:hypothetical protein
MRNHIWQDEFPILDGPFVGEKLPACPSEMKDGHLDDTMMYPFEGAKSEVIEGYVPKFARHRWNAAESGWNYVEDIRVPDSKLTANER